MISELKKENKNHQGTDKQEERIKRLLLFRQSRSLNNSRTKYSTLNMCKVR